jgi:hypothetical protein
MLLSCLAYSTLKMEGDVSLYGIIVQEIELFITTSV